MLFLGPVLRGISVSLWFIGATCIACVCDQLKVIKNRLSISATQMLSVWRAGLWSVATTGHSMSQLQVPSYILIVSRPKSECLHRFLSPFIHNYNTGLQKSWLLENIHHYGDWWLWTPTKNLVNYCKMSVQMVGKPSQGVSHYHSSQYCCISTVYILHTTICIV